MEKGLKEELGFCLELWEMEGGCTFGGGNNCEECAAPYVLLKLISGEVLHGEDMDRLSLDEWKKKVKNLE